MEEQSDRVNIRKIRPFLADCCVLLRSDGSFPLEGPCRIACFGRGAYDTVKGGTGSGEVNSRYSVTVEEALVDEGFIITNRDWYKKYRPFYDAAEKKFCQDIRKTAKREKMNIIAASMGKVMTAPEYDIDLDLSADAAIYVLSRISGEGNDRLDAKGDFRLNDSEIRDIKALDKAYKRFMLIINAGGPVDLSEVMDTRNILNISQLGVETGYAVSDILLGKQTPSGKLATTWASYDDYCHEGSFGEKDDTLYKEGIYVGYRYFDAAGKKPLFPFGYGLSYTDLDVKITSVTADHEVISIKGKVTNTGNRNGKEVVQAYIQAPQGRLDREEKSLAAFYKTVLLAPGEEDAFEMSFKLTDFAGYDAESESYILESGAYTVLIGNSSEDVMPAKSFQLQKDVTVRKVKNQFAETGFDDYRNENRKDHGEPAFGTTALDLSNIETVTAGYDMPLHTADILETLTDEELAYLNTGNFDPKGGFLSVIGDASKTVAGAAGETTSMLEGKGIKNLILADGPAGLRLAKEYYVDKKGAHSVAPTIPESMLGLLPKPVKWFVGLMTKLKRTNRILRQYTTGIPIATAVAQSWNTDFAGLCGDIVGSEMEKFNVDLWLAPAVNIHRNVLCGRNFEYYSEDPVITGIMASSMISAVQKHGKGVTVKHFAANNQETNRYANNSVISERAVREIYLKAFQMCIEKSSPMALMTSYNLLNGTHTSESRQLDLNILRGEFGFSGLIMTDWVVGSGLLTQGGKYRDPDAALVAAAGHSLFMPGSRKDFEEIMKGLEEGTVTRSRLTDNAYYLLKTIDMIKQNGETENERLHGQGNSSK